MNTMEEAPTGVMFQSPGPPPPLVDEHQRNYGPPVDQQQHYFHQHQQHYAATAGFAPGAAANHDHLKNSAAHAQNYPQSGHTPPSQQQAQQQPQGHPAATQGQGQGHTQQAAGTPHQVMYMPQQHNPRFMRPSSAVSRGVNPGQQRPPLNMNSTPGQYYPTTTMFMSGTQAPFVTHPGQSHVIIQSGPPLQVGNYAPQHAQFGAQRMPTPQQHTLPSPQTQHPIQAPPQQQSTQYTPQSGQTPQNMGGYHFQPNQHNNPTVFYNPMPPATQQPGQTTPQPQVTQNQEKRKKNVILIQDPNTMEDKTETILGSSRSSSTPAPSEGSAGDQSETSSTRETPSRETPAQETPATSPPPTSQGENTVKAAFISMVARAAYNNTDQDETNVTPIPSHVPPQSGPTAHPTVTPVAQPIMPPVAHGYGPTQTPVVVAMPDVAPGTPPIRAAVFHHQPPLAAAAPPVAAAAAAGSSVQSVPDAAPQMKQAQVAAQDSAAAAAATAEENDDGKEGKKKSRKQKLKDLNEKGEKKAGSEMDAFNMEEGAPNLTQNEKVKDVSPAAGAAAATDETSTTEEPASEATPTEQPTAAAHPEAAANGNNDVTGKSAPCNQQTSQPQRSDVVTQNAAAELGVVPGAPISQEDAAANHVGKAADMESEEAERTAENDTPVIKKDKIELKYAYREDQWSPINPEGKKAYDRSFLLQLQNSKESRQKPEGLPMLPDVILDRPRNLSLGDLRMGPRPSPSGPGGPMGGFSPNVNMPCPPDFSPNFFKPGGSRSGHAGGAGGRSRGMPKGRNEPPKKIIVINQIDHKLHRSENAYKVGQAPANMQAPPEGIEDPDMKKAMDVLRTVRSIMNKLTPQKFQVLVGKVLELEINTEYRLKQTIDIIFEKAIDEPNFSVAYANLCKHMVLMKVDTINPENNEKMQISFRKLLINRCQREFEKEYLGDVDIENREEAIKECTESDKKKQLQEELDLDIAKSKRRTLGNIRFIGELYKLKMLTENIMHGCIMKLLKASDAESLECLCRLLKTVGKELDHEVARHRMDQYFDKMRKIVKEKKKITQRVGFMIQDVLDLRQNNWIPRREDNNPKTLDQIHKEVAREELERALYVQNLPQQQRMPPRGAQGGGGGGGGGGRRSQDDHGWTNVDRKPPRQAIDPQRMRFNKHNDNEKIALHPGAGTFGNWGKGASGGGSRTSSQENERPSTPNRYAALNSADRLDSFDSRNRGGRGGASSSRSGGRQSMGERRSQGGGPQSGGRYANRQTSDDRESAIQAVKSISQSSNDGRHTPSGRTPTGSRNQSRESSRSRDVPREEGATAAPPGGASAAAPAPGAPGKPQLTLEEMEKKVKAIVDEYLHLLDMKEAVLCVTELKKEQLDLFVSMSMEAVLERSSQARTNIGRLHCELFKQNHLKKEQYIVGLNKILVTVEDVEIDIPKIWTYLGELISPVISGHALSLNVVREVRCDKSAVLAAQVLLAMIPGLGKVAVKAMWVDAGLRWSQLLPEGAVVSEHLERQKLDPSFGDTERSRERTMSVNLASLNEELAQLLPPRQQDPCSNEMIFDWISENVADEHLTTPQFARALMTAVANSVIDGKPSVSGMTLNDPDVLGPKDNMKLNSDLLKKRSLVLVKYFDRNTNLELQGVYALQALMHKLDHPSELLRSFFDTLYDEGAIADSTFYVWYESKDELVGKPLAMESVSSFFTWIFSSSEEAQ